MAKNKTLTAPIFPEKIGAVRVSDFGLRPKPRPIICANNGPKLMCMLVFVKLDMH